MFSRLNIAASSVGWLCVSCASEPLEETHNYYFISNSSKTVILPSPSFYFEFVDGALYTVDSTCIHGNTAVLRVLML